MSGRSWEENGNPLQFSCLENPMGGGRAWQATVRVTNRRHYEFTFTFTFFMHRRVASYYFSLLNSVETCLRCNMWSILRIISCIWKEFSNILGDEISLTYLVLKESSTLATPWILQSMERSARILEDLSNLGSTRSLMCHLRQQFPNFSHQGSYERQFFHGLGGVGMINNLYLLCTFFLI